MINLSSKDGELQGCQSKFEQAVASRRPRGSVFCVKLWGTFVHVQLWQSSVTTLAVRHMFTDFFLPIGLSSFFIRVCPK